MKFRMKYCNYCNFIYFEAKEYVEHLNKKHIKCLCGKVFDKKDSADNLALCKECKEQNK